MIGAVALVIGIVAGLVLRPTVPTWLERIVSRCEWKAPPSRSVTGVSPYQLRSATVPSALTRVSASPRPSPDPLV